MLIMYTLSHMKIMKHSSIIQTPFTLNRMYEPWVNNVIFILYKLAYNLYLCICIYTFETDSEKLLHSI